MIEVCCVVYECEAPEDRVEPQDTALLDPIARADAQLRARTDRHARARAELERARASLGGDLAARTLDDDVRQRRAARESDLDDAKARASRLAELSRLVGSADGRKLRRIAQARALELVLEHANVHLAHLARRYTLRPIDGGLHLMVQDHELFGQARSVTSLSGGETFLVSLALALGLASLSAERVQIETLFIDEGFGSLDARSMQLALGALERLQAEGRQIGIISHLRELTERVGREVRVRPAGAGRSVVELDPRR
jgi:exonuclease SbcC